MNALTVHAEWDKTNDNAEEQSTRSYAEVYERERREGTIKRRSFYRRGRGGKSWRAGAMC